MHFFRKKVSDREQQLSSAPSPGRLCQNKMEKLLLFLLLCHSSSAVKHSLKYIVSSSSEASDLPEFVAVAQVDDAPGLYCDSDTKKAEPKQFWIQLFFTYIPDQLQMLSQQCSVGHQRFKKRLHSLMQHFNQSEGVHTLQLISGCEKDEDTGDVTSFMQFGYDGEDFLSLDLKTEIFIAQTQKADNIKLQWEAEKSDIKSHVFYLTQFCPEWLNKFLQYGRRFLKRTGRPSVSLLQKSPSSPVSCHATGFYPDRAVMLWRKDGEDLHEDVDQGEILPNHDGTFQMSVDLKPSSPEDWSRYDCVFQLHGLKDDIVTRLDKSVIRTNQDPPSQFPAAAVIGVVVGLLLLILCISGLFMWRRNNHGFRPANTSDSSPSSVPDQLNMTSTQQ